MTDPTPPGTLAALALGALIALLGPLVGQLVLVVAAAFLGALLALSRAETPTIAAGLWLLARGAGLAVLVAGGLSWLWLEMFGGRYAEALAMVSALVGFRTDWVLERAKAWTNSRFGGAA